LKYILTLWETNFVMLSALNQNINELNLVISRRHQMMEIKLHFQNHTAEKILRFY